MPVKRKKSLFSFLLKEIYIESIAKDGKIQTLEKDIETVRNEVKTSQESQV